METVKIHLNTEHSVGLGDDLCMLSLLTNIYPQVELHVSDHNNMFSKLSNYVKILRIPQSQLYLVKSEDQNGDFRNVGWPLKLFNEYHRPYYVSVNGRVLKTKDGQHKNCIAFVPFSKTKEGEENQWPWVKGRPEQFWAEHYMWLKKLEFEVITMDSTTFDLETKIEMLVRHCKAIVTYEGGMAHLAHMLKIPCFLIDWKHPSPNTSLGEYHCDFVHRTDNVHIVRHDLELLSWNRDIMSRNITALENGQTNNRIINGDIQLDFYGPYIRGDLKIRDKQGRLLHESGSIFGNNVCTDLLVKYIWK